MPVAHSMLEELEDALTNQSADKRISTLRRITDLFLNDADRLNEQQIAVFDDVLVRLVQTVETKARIQLSTSLAPLTNSPVETVQRLARDADIAVAGPVLSQSNRLSDADLVEIASTSSQGHLLAISGRSSLAETVTDVLVERGDRQVAHKLAKNVGARFSEAGYASLVRKSEADESLAEQLGMRLDMPLQLLRQLLSRATDIVRARLLAATSPENRDRIKNVLESIFDEVRQKAAKPRDYTRAVSFVESLNREGKLNESALARFANENRYEEMTATLGLLSGASADILDQIMNNAHIDGLMTACKAAKLSWPTVIAIMKARSPHHLLLEAELQEAKAAFLTISQAAAQRTMRFMQVQNAAKTKVPA